MRIDCATNAAASPPGKLARRAAHTGETGALESVEAERAPVVAPDVPRDEVPPPSGGHELVRLDQPARVVAVASAVVEPHLLAVATREREHRERVGVDRRDPPSDHCNDATLVCTASTRRRNRSGSTCSSFASARSAVSSMPSIDALAGRAQPDRDRDGFVVVEQERRHVRAGREAVATAAAGRGVDGVAERAEAVDVAPQGARRSPRGVR